MKEVDEVLYTRLILSHRTKAHKIAWHLLRKWNARMDRDDLESVADLSLCEAARRFDPNREACFLTYLFHYVRGSLIRTFHTASRRALLIDDGATFEIESLDDAVGFEQQPSHGTSPEDSVNRAELSSTILRLFESLSPLEREVIEKVHILEYKVSTVAKMMGYSRGHVSMVRRDAFRKLRPKLENFREAA